MKDVSDKLYSALITLISGNVTYGGDNIPVYHVLPQSIGNDYIYIAEYNLNEASTKDRFEQNGYINIQVVTRFDTETYSEKKINSICNQVKNLLKPTVTSVPSLSPLFNCTFFYLENDLMDYSLEQVDNVVRRILRYRMEIEEL